MWSAGACSRCLPSGLARTCSSRSPHSRSHRTSTSCRHPARPDGGREPSCARLCFSRVFCGRATQSKDLSSIYKPRNRTSKGGSSTPCPGASRKTKSAGRSARNDTRSPTHRRRLFFTPTGTCAKPPPGVKIFLVSSYYAHSPHYSLLCPPWAISQFRRARGVNYAKL